MKKQILRHNQSTRSSLNRSVPYVSLNHHVNAVREKYSATQTHLLDSVIQTPQQRDDVKLCKYSLANSITFAANARDYIAMQFSIEATPQRIICSELVNGTRNVGRKIKKSSRRPVGARRVLNGKLSCTCTRAVVRNFVPSILILKPFHDNRTA